MVRPVQQPTVSDDERRFKARTSNSLALSSRAAVPCGPSLSLSLALSLSLSLLLSFSLHALHSCLYTRARGTSLDAAKLWIRFTVCWESREERRLLLSRSLQQDPARISRAVVDSKSNFGVLSVSDSNVCPTLIFLH